MSGRAIQPLVSARDPDSPAARTILLFGMPRSGTTWIGKTFDSHPDTLYLHEPDSHARIPGLPPVVPVADYAAHERSVRDYVARLREVRAVPVLGKLPLFHKAYYPPGYRQLLTAAIVAAKAAGKVGYRGGLPDWGGVRRARAPVVVWKSIESLGALPLILRHASDAVAVHILRHPCGYVASVRRGEATGQFGGAVPDSEDYGYFDLLLRTEVAAPYGLDRAALARLSPVERLAWRWVLVNTKAWGELQGDPRYRLVEYEALCRAPSAEFRPLFEFAGLVWQPATERFLAESTQGEDTGYYSVIRNAEAAADAWRTELDARDQKAVMVIVRRCPLGARYASYG